ncbi:MAG TPA: HAD-IA family hydrolase [Burkholderiales bacterium]
MAVRAVLFDLDGTLADTASDLARALNSVRAERGLGPVPPAMTRPHTSKGARGLLGVGMGVAPEHATYESLRDRFLEYYARELCVDTKLFDGIPELLGTLRERGVAWGVVTNKPGRFTVPLMRQLDPNGTAACVVSGDTTPKSKPFPEPLLHAAREIDVPPRECLYVGDDLRDVQAARAAGMGVVVAAWGYLGDAGDPAGWGADAVIAHPRETLNFI